MKAKKIKNPTLDRYGRGGVLDIVYARSTLPERRQREHTATVVGVPLTIAFTLRMLGFQLLFVLRLEWETL